MNEHIMQQQDRILYLSGDIESNNVSEVCKQILSIQNEDRVGSEKFKKWEYRPIQLHIQSFGGSIHDMWALIDIMETSPTPIITYCSGMCMSAAAMIFLAGHIRCMYKHSTIMFHQLSSFMVGKYEDIKLEQVNLDDMHKQMIKFIKKHTNLNKKFYERFGKLKQDVYLDSDKCLKYGVCDDIIEPTEWRKELLQNIAALEQAATESVCDAECDCEC